jgi:DNA-directed RNA polymerase specialized sigma24 family protein
MSMIASPSIRKQSLYMFARGSLCGATPERGRFRSFLLLPGLTFIDFQRAEVGPFGFTTLVPAGDSGTESPFATTHWSVVLKAGESGTPQAAAALEKLCLVYWEPIYGYIRRQGCSPHDAQDLTQSFLARLLARDFAAGLDPRKGKFRSFLLVAINHFLSNERLRAGAAKRGGGRVPVPLDQDLVEARFLQDKARGLAPGALFDRRWALTLLERSFIRLQEEAADAEALRFDQLKPFLSCEGTQRDYAAAGEKLHLTAGAVKVAVHRLRQRYGQLLRAEVAQTVSNSSDLEEEMHYLLELLAADGQESREQRPFGGESL